MANLGAICHFILVCLFLAYRRDAKRFRKGGIMKREGKTSPKNKLAPHETDGTAAPTVLRQFAWSSPGSRSLLNTKAQAGMDTSKDQEEGSGASCISKTVSKSSSVCELSTSKLSQT